MTNTANRVDASNAAPDLAKLRQHALHDGRPSYSARPIDLAWIVDGGTYAKLLALTEFLTMEKAGPLATAQTGQIGFADGAPVLVSSEMPLTEADGKVGTRHEQHQRHSPVRLSSRLVRGLPPPHRRQRGLSAVLRQLPADRHRPAGLHQLRHRCRRRAV